MVTLRDNLTMDASARICADGCLVAEVRAARVGIQDYLGHEVDPEGTKFQADQLVRVYRPEAEVFKTDSMASFAAAPFTIDHPSEAVTADNWKRLGVGEVNGDVVRDGSFVRVPVIVRDAGAVGKVRTTHKQLSMGYACNLDFTPGTFDGQAYDAIQKDIRINHIAAVPAARGGSELRITDERAQEPPIMKKILIDGLQVDLSDASAVEAAITKLQGQLADSATKLAAAETQVATLTTQAATKDAEIVTLKQQVTDAKVTPAQMRDAAKAYALVVDQAKKLGVTVTDAMDEGAIKKAAVLAKVGDAAKDWNDEQIAASFGTLTANLGDFRPDPLRSVISDGVTNIADAAAARNAARAAQY